MPHGFEQRISPRPLRRLTNHTHALGLKHGAAELLRRGFGEDMVAARSGLNFHAWQKQAILNAIVAHKVLGAATLLDLYQQVAPDALSAPAPGKTTLLASVSSSCAGVKGNIFTVTFHTKRKRAKNQAPALI